jgi:hypothetical protein
MKIRAFQITLKITSESVSYCCLKRGLNRFF